MIKNALFYTLTTPLETARLNESLSKMRFAEIGKLEAQSVGFEPLEQGQDLLMDVQGIRAGCVRIDKKSIPGSALKELLKERCCKLEEVQGYAPGRKQTKEIKERLVDELLPHVLPTTKRVKFLVFNDLMVMDTSSSATADLVLGLLSRCVDPFPLGIVRTESSPAAAMTRWLIDDEPPATFSVDQEAEMKAANESRASVRWKNQSVDGEEATDHFRQGKQCIKLALTWADRISFALNDKGGISKIKALDLLTKTREEDATDQGMEADIALFGGELHKLIHDLIGALGGEVA